MQRTIKLRSYDGWSGGMARLIKSIQADSEQSKKDPFHPLPRSKGEKARNRSRRGVR